MHSFQWRAAGSRGCPSASRAPDLAICGTRDGLMCGPAFRRSRYSRRRRIARRHPRCRQHRPRRPARARNRREAVVSGRRPGRCCRYRESAASRAAQEQTSSAPIRPKQRVVRTLGSDAFGGAACLADTAQGALPRGSRGGGRDLECDRGGKRDHRAPRRATRAPTRSRPNTPRHPNCRTKHHPDTTHGRDHWKLSGTLESSLGGNT